MQVAWNPSLLTENPAVSKPPLTGGYYGGQEETSDAGGFDCIATKYVSSFCFRKKLKLSPLCPEPAHRPSPSREFKVRQVHPQVITVVPHFRGESVPDLSGYTW